MFPSNRTTTTLLLLVIFTLIILPSIMIGPFERTSAAKTDSFTLNGSFTGGWNGTMPGPTLTVTAGDTVSLTLKSVDTYSHLFYVDVNGNHSPDCAYPVVDKCSPNISAGQTVQYSFLVDFARGTYNYYCQYHSSPMYGSLIVNPSSTPPSQGSNDTIIIGGAVAAVGIIAIVGFLLFRRNRKS